MLLDSLLPDHPHREMDLKPHPCRIHRVASASIARSERSSSIGREMCTLPSNLRVIVIAAIFQDRQNVETKRTVKKCHYTTTTWVVNKVGALPHHHREHPRSR